MAGDVDDCEQEVAEFGDGVVVVARFDRFGQFVGFLVHLREGTGDVGPVEADLRRLASHGRGVAQRRQRPGNPVEHRGATLLDPLDLVPVREHLVGPVDGDVTEHVRVPADEFVVDALCDIGDREAALLFGDHGMELDLVQEVAEFLDQVVVGRRVVGAFGIGECLECVDDLVGLFQQVRDQRLVGLFDVPRTLLAQGPSQLVEADVPVADRRCQVWHVDRGEMVGVDRTVHVGPGRVEDLLVGGTERMQDRHRLVAGGILDRQLDVAEDPVRMGVGDQQWAGLPGRRSGEVVAVDEPDPLLDRVDAEPSPRDVEERHRRPYIEVDALRRTTLAEQLDRSFEHERRTGHGVEHRAVVPGVGHQTVGEAGVHLLEGVGVDVEVVVGDGAAGRVGDEMGGRMDRGPEVAARGPLDRRERVGRDVLRMARAQADDGDRRALRCHRAQPSGMTLALARS